MVVIYSLPGPRAACWGGTDSQQCPERKSRALLCLGVPAWAPTEGALTHQLSSDSLNLCFQNHPHPSSVILEFRLNWPPLMSVRDSSWLAFPWISHP